MIPYFRCPVSSSRVRSCAASIALLTRCLVLCFRAAGGHGMPDIPMGRPDPPPPQPPPPQPPSFPQPNSGGGGYPGGGGGGYPQPTNGGGGGYPGGGGGYPAQPGGGGYPPQPPAGGGGYPQPGGGGGYPPQPPAGGGYPQPGEPVLELGHFCSRAPCPAYRRKCAFSDSGRIFALFCILYSRVTDNIRSKIKLLSCSQKLCIFFFFWGGGVMFGKRDIFKYLLYLKDSVTSCCCPSHVLAYSLNGVEHLVFVFTFTRFLHK